MAPVAADSADAAAIDDEPAPACPAAVPGPDRSTGETSGPPADADDAAEGETGAPDTGAVGTDGIAEVVTTGGRKSEPYAGSGPVGTAGPLPTAPADQGVPVTTAGATGAAALAGGTGVAELVWDASTGPSGAVKAAPLDTADAATAGGAVSGGAVCGGAVPDSIAFIAPDDTDCVPAAAGCPVAIPVVIDCPNPGEMPWPRLAAGDTGALGSDGLATEVPGAGPPTPMVVGPVGTDGALPGN